MSRHVRKIWSISIVRTAPDPHDGSTRLASERHVYILIKVIEKIVTLAARGYDHQEPQRRTES